MLVGIAPEKWHYVLLRGSRVSLDIVGEEIGWKKPSRCLNVAAKPLNVENSGLIPGSKWQNAWRALPPLYSGTDIEELALGEGLRAAVGIAIPIAIGLLANHLVWGNLCAFGTFWVLSCDVGGAYRQKAINLAASSLAIIGAFIFGGWLIESVTNYVIGVFLWVSSAALIGVARKRRCSGRPGEFDDRRHFSGALCSQ